MEKVTTNPTNSTKATTYNNSNNITDYELARLREKMSKKPSPVEGVDNIVSYNVPKTTLETIRLLVDSLKQCKEDLRTTKERLRKVVSSIGPDLDLIEGLEDDLKEVVTKMLEESTDQPLAKLESTNPSLAKLGTPVAPVAKFGTPVAPVAKFGTPTASVKEESLANTIESAILESETDSDSNSDSEVINPTNPLNNATVSQKGGTRKYYIKYL